MKRILVFLIGILSVSCEKQTDINNNYQNSYVIDYEKYSDFEYNDTIDLKYGNCIKDFSNQTILCFDSVLTDSRCPENVICIWAGEAIVRFRIIKDRNEPVFLDLHVGTIDTIVYDYKFSFLDLLPYPNTEIQRDINEYKAKVIIKRK